MRAQLSGLERALARGVPRVGWKIGINDPAMQRRLGLAGPVVGALNGEVLISSGGCFSLTPGAIVRAEAERTNAQQCQAAADRVIST